jgi:chorismate mutase
MSSPDGWWRRLGDALGAGRGARVRAIRGATTVDVDEPGSLRAATAELIAEIVRRNELRQEQVISAFFTTTADLHSAFPAEAVRALGWTDVPLLCAAEIPVPDALPRCVRVLLHVEQRWRRRAVRHVYLRAARQLRPDLVAD